MIEPSPKHNILFKWLFWHFIEVPKEILKAWKNFLVFNFHYFSVVGLLKSLLAPWRRQTESYGKGFDPKRYLTVFASNMISRVLGAAVRTVIILLGLIFEVLVFAAGLAVLISWLLLPALVLAGFFCGMGLLI